MLLYKQRIVQHTTSEFVADDNQPIFVHHWSPNEGTSLRGIVHIAHGMSEHAARYAPLAQALVDRGYIVHAHDHRGHGQTARLQGGQLGVFANHDGWTRVVRDLDILIDHEQREHPELPMVLIAHSMGSFISQDFLQQHGKRLRAVVLSASDGKPDWLASVGRYVARAERMRVGAKSPSPVLQSLSFDAFNKQFKPNRTSADWLSRDTAQVDAYVADPLCGFAVSTGLWVDFLDALPIIASPERRAMTPPELPMFVIAGGDDPVSKQTRGLVELVQGYRNAGVREVSHRFYPAARHEIFNEINRAEVMRDVTDWIDLKVAPH